MSLMESTPKMARKIKIHASPAWTMRNATPANQPTKAPRHFVVANAQPIKNAGIKSPVWQAMKAEGRRNRPGRNRWPGRPARVEMNQCLNRWHCDQKLPLDCMGQIESPSALSQLQPLRPIFVVQGIFCKFSHRTCGKMRNLFLRASAAELFRPRRGRRTLARGLDP